jgi:hypothetical protein
MDNEENNEGWQHQSYISIWEGLILNEKMLSKPNVKVVFHQMAIHVTPLSAWIIYLFGPLSAIPHPA